MSAVVADAYLAGVSTRRMDKLVKTLCPHSLSKSQVSRIATGVNADGHREVLRKRVATSATGMAWNLFFADLVAGGITGVSPIASHALARPGYAMRSNRPGAGWQRCRTHFPCPKLKGVRSKRMWPVVSAMLNSVYGQ